VIILSGTPDPTSAVIPLPQLMATRNQTPTPTVTSSPLPTLTFTPLPEKAPDLPPINVSFITNGSRDKPYVALTFDLCQKPEYPASFDQGIFDALVQANAPATFFVGGHWALTHPEETRLLASIPYFELGNHSWDHPDLIDLDREAISQQILKTQQILWELTGKQPRLFRLPAGLYNNLVLSVISAHGLYTIQWELVTADPVPDNSAKNINRIVREGVQNGSIIIMHANGRGWNTAEALPEMIGYLRGQGYILVTVSQLIGLAPLQPSSQYIQ
jgi:peptidoglycan-N-acetylglucosamine deacetylase